MATPTPSEAIAHGLEADVLGEAQEKLAEVHEEIFELTDFEHHDMALEKALNYACTWGFVTGYTIVFDARIGILPNGDESNLAIFLSFNIANTVNTSRIEEGDNSAGDARLEDNNTKQVQTEVGEALQQNQEERNQGMSYVTKRWVAQRILRLMLRCYGGITFPKSVWFVEDWAGSRPPCLLLPYASTVPDQDGRAEKVRERIINQIIVELRAMNLYWENLQGTEGHGN